MRLLGRFLLTLVALVIAFSVIFHILMAWEGQKHSWITGFYWSLTVMSTLGFGDITFHSDIGRLFSIVVLISGVVFLLILLPFTLIEFFYAPWVESRNKRIVRDRVSNSVSKHILLLKYDSVSSALIEKLDRHGIHYALLTPDTDECLQLTDLGINAFAGDANQAETYERLRLDQAAIVALTGNDFENARQAFKIRSLHPDIPIISAADSKSSSEVIRLSGANKAFQLANIIGEALARRTIGGSSLHHVVAHFDELLIAEALADSPQLAGKTLAEADLRKNAGINVIGTWERGEFTTSRPDTVIHSNTVLLLAGSKAQLERFDQTYRNTSKDNEHVIVIGAGRVGTAVCKTLDSRDTDYRVIDRSAEATKQFGPRGITGDASNFDTLHIAGIIEARSVIITSHDDDLEVYLTIFCRKLRPDIQIVCRASESKTIGELHQAGADIVLSYASIGANIIFNFLNHSDILMVAEGLNIFKAHVPAALQGRTLAQENLRAQTGCNVIAVRNEDGLQAPPRPNTPISPEAELILIGDTASERRFFDYLKSSTSPAKT